MDQWPVVECIAITDENGWLLGSWCNPGYMTSGNSLILYSNNIENDSPELCMESQLLKSDVDSIITPISIPIDSQLEYPYPNPCSDQVVITFSLEVLGAVSIWVVPATTHPQESSQSNLFAGHVFYSEKGIVIKELFNRDNTNPGSYQVRWDLKDYIGNNIPAGFYRIYALLNGQLLYQDVLVYHKPDDLPQDLRMGLRIE
jgi:hypothetical protein